MRKVECLIKSQHSDYLFKAFLTNATVGFPVLITSDIILRGLFKISHHMPLPLEIKLELHLHNLRVILVPHSYLLPFILTLH